jgi:hypothetical protein
LIYIYAVRFAGGKGHSHITRVRWKNPDNGKSGELAQQGMVDWIANKGGSAYVCGGGHLARVGIVRADPPYIRTYADGVWSDNLLKLNTF